MSKPSLRKAKLAGLVIVLITPMLDARPDGSQVTLSLRAQRDVPVVVNSADGDAQLDAAANGPADQPRSMGRTVMHTDGNFSVPPGIVHLNTRAAVTPGDELAAAILHLSGWALLLVGLGAATFAVYRKLARG